MFRHPLKVYTVQGDVHFRPEQTLAQLKQAGIDCQLSDRGVVVIEAGKFGDAKNGLMKQSIGIRRHGH